MHKLLNDTDSSYIEFLIVKLSQSLNLSLSLRDRDRADTIITLYHTTPPKTFQALKGDLYSSVIHHWNRQLKLLSSDLKHLYFYLLFMS